MTIDPMAHIICSECAKANHATWPEGHLATFWNGTCQICNKSRAVCEVSDWNWPVGGRPKTFSMANRD